MMIEITKISKYLCRVKLTLTAMAYSFKHLLLPMVLIAFIIMVAARFPIISVTHPKEETTTSFKSEDSASFLTPEEAAKSVGKIVSVKGKVISTFYAKDIDRKPTFLNINHPFPNNDIAIVILKEDLHAFPLMNFYEGKEIGIEGKVTLWKYEAGEKPVIYITHPEQIRVF
jgi:hypothetical protein